MAQQQTDGTALITKSRQNDVNIRIRTTDGTVFWRLDGVSNPAKTGITEMTGIVDANDYNPFFFILINRQGERYAFSKKFSEASAQ